MNTAGQALPADMAARIIARVDELARISETPDALTRICFTPEHRGIAPHHTSPPQQPEEFAEFCARMVRRYAPASGYASNRACTVMPFAETGTAAPSRAVAR